LVPKRFRESLAEMRDVLMSGHGNYAQYRAAVESALSRNQPMIPYFGVCTRDFTFIEDGNEMLLNGLVNFHRMRLVSSVIKLIQQMQTRSYNFAPLPALQELIRATPEYTDKELIKFSTTNEPTESQQ
jgi:hypothetical protein